MNGTLLKSCAVMAATCTAVTAGGCSWIGVTRAPERPVSAAPPAVCTRSVAAPVGDTILGGLAVIAGGALIYTSSHQICLSGCPTDQGLLWGGIAAVAAGVTLGVSAGFGYAWTAECREIQEQQSACISGIEASCAALRVLPAKGETSDAPKVHGPQPR